VRHDESHAKAAEVGAHALLEVAAEPTHVQHADVYAAGESPYDPLRQSSGRAAVKRRESEREWRRDLWALAALAAITATMCIWVAH